MSRRAVPVRMFLLAAILALTLVPVASGAAAWAIEAQRQDAETQHRLDAATAYLTANREAVGRDDKDAIFGVRNRLAHLHLIATFGVLDKAKVGKRDVTKTEVLPFDRGVQSDARDFKPPQSWHSHEITIPLGASGPGAAIVGTLYSAPPDLTTRALVALAAAVVVLLAGLSLSIWLAGRWIVKPLSHLSVEVDKIAGGELAVAVPTSRISEVANVTAAIDGMAAALGETGQQQAAADEARRFLVTAVAHDLRTPLFALRGHLEAIRSDLGDPVDHLAKAADRATSLERLIASLFIYARHDFAPEAPVLEVEQLGDLVRSVADGFPSGALVLEGDDDLAVIVDRERFERSLANVFDNAIRHTPPEAAVEVTWRGRDSVVDVTVADRGPGIDADLLPRVFQPMVRGDRSRHRLTGGGGLGLTIAKRLIESQEGSIAVENRSDGGARFTLTLRRAVHSAAG